MEHTDRVARRAEQARAVRHRRRVVGLSLLGVAAIIVAAVVLLGNGAGGGGSAKSAASSHTAGSTAANGKGSAHAKPSALLGPIPASAPGAHRAPTEPVPILMYHVIGTPKPGTPYPELWVTASDFSAQMHALAGAGLSRRDAPAGLGRVAPRRPAPVQARGRVLRRWLQRPVQGRDARAAAPRHWPGVLNLKLGNLARPEGRARAGDDRRRLGDRLPHHQPPRPDRGRGDQLRYELGASRGAFQQALRRARELLLLPGRPLRPGRDREVRNAGFKAATTTLFGYARPSDTWSLARVRVNRSDGAAGLLAKLKATDPSAAPVLRSQGGA